MTNGKPASIVHSPVSITISVWRALFLREAINRLAAGRSAWLWLIIEPAIHMALTIFIFTVIRLRVVSGMHSAIWLMSGLLAMFMFMRTGSQSKNALSANKALFAYRQVKPFDTVLSRACLEGFLMTLISLFLYGVTFLFDIGVFPDEPLLMLTAFLGLWLTGLGYGLITSAIVELIPEFEKILKIVMAPIYIVSGVVFSINSVPLPYRSWLLYNPIAHGIETVRASISSYYHPFPEVNVGYTYGCALTFIFIGLVLHKRFAVQLVTK